MPYKISSRTSSRCKLVKRRLLRSGLMHLWWGNAEGERGAVLHYFMGSPSAHVWRLPLQDQDPLPLALSSCVSTLYTSWDTIIPYRTESAHFFGASETHEEPVLARATASRPDAGSRV